MNKRMKTIAAIAGIVVGIAVWLVLAGNVFNLNLPDWAHIVGIGIGIPFVVWGLMYLILSNKKKE